MSNLNVYTCNNFRGHYPVGSAAVVVAADHEHGANLLEQLLTAQGLSQIVAPGQLTFFCEAGDGVSANARILVNGEY